MPESPALKEYNKPEENILSTKKTPEEIRKMIESNGIDVADIIELKKIRDKMKTDFTNLKNELQKPEKPGKPTKPENPPEIPGRPSAPTGLRIEKPEKPGKPVKPENPPEVPGTPTQVVDSTPSGNTAIEAGQYVPGIDGVPPTPDSGIPINIDPKW